MQAFNDEFEQRIWGIWEKYKDTIPKVKVKEGNEEKTFLPVPKFLYCADYDPDPDNKNKPHIYFVGLNPSFQDTFIKKQIKKVFNIDSNKADLKFSELYNFDNLLNCSSDEQKNRILKLNLLDAISISTKNLEKKYTDLIISENLQINTDKDNEYSYFKAIKKLSKTLCFSFTYLDLFLIRESGSIKLDEYLKRTDLQEFFSEQIKLFIDFIYKITDNQNQDKNIFIFTNKTTAFYILEHIINPKSKSRKYKFLKENNVKDTKISTNHNEDGICEIYIKGKKFVFSCIYELVNRRVEEDLKKLSVEKVEELIKEKINV